MAMEQSYGPTTTANSAADQRLKAGTVSNAINKKMASTNNTKKKIVKQSIGNAVAKKESLPSFLSYQSKPNSQVTSTSGQDDKNLKKAFSSDENRKKLLKSTDYSAWR